MAKNGFYSASRSPHMYRLWLMLLVASPAILFLQYDASDLQDDCTTLYDAKFMPDTPLDRSSYCEVRFFDFTVPSYISAIVVAVCPGMNVAVAAHHRAYLKSLNRRMRRYVRRAPLFNAEWLEQSGLLEWREKIAVLGLLYNRHYAMSYH